MDKIEKTVDLIDDLDNDFIYDIKGLLEKHKSSLMGTKDKLKKIWH